MDPVILLLLIGSVITNLTTYLLSSRCTKIKCGSCEINRDVLPSKDVTKLASLSVKD